MAAATNLGEISERIKHMKFKRKLFGGVDEKDVWKQIRELDADYRNMFKIQYEMYRHELRSLNAKYAKANAKKAAPKEA